MHNTQNIQQISQIGVLPFTKAKGDFFHVHCECLQACVTLTLAVSSVALTSHVWVVVSSTRADVRTGCLPGAGHSGVLAALHTSAHLVEPSEKLLEEIRTWEGLCG